MAPTPDPTNPPHEHEGLLDRLDDFKDRIEEAAIQAEFDTGEREETVEEAKAHALVRLGRMTLGTIVVIVGIIALPLPGPGWLIIAGGLTILSKDVAWADRLLRQVRKRVPGIPEDGKIPRSSLVTMALVTLAAVSASLWWTLARGSDDIQAGTYTVVAITEDGTSQDVDDEGIEFTLTTDGPVTLGSNACDVTLDVVERSKTEFVLADSQAACDSDIVDQSLLATNDDQQIVWQLGHETDGIVNWFFADDELRTLIGGDGTTYQLRPSG